MNGANETTTAHALAHTHWGDGGGGTQNGKNFFFPLAPPPRRRLFLNRTGPSLSDPPVDVVVVVSKPIALAPFYCTLLPDDLPLCVDYENSFGAFLIERRGTSNSL